MKKLIILFSALALGYRANAQLYAPVAVSGFNADVVANGFGAATSSTTQAVDAVDFNLVAQDFINPSNQSPTSYLPNSGLINSVVASTPGLSYQLAPYTGNNDLRITGTGNGTLTFTTPRTADQIFVLGFTGSGSSTVTITVTFTDATTQVFTGQVFNDWFNGTGFAIQGISRVNRTTNAIENLTTNPRLYQIMLSLSAANVGKTIQSVRFNKTTSTGVLNIMGISVRSLPPTQANDVAVTAITAPNSGCILTNQETVTVTLTNFGSAAQSNIPVSYTINGGTAVNEIVAGPIAPGSTTSYSFTTKANLSTSGNYTIAARTNLATDAVPTNDEFSKSIILNNVPAAPTVTASGPLAICTGDNVTLTASASSGGTYQWFKNGTAISGATSTTYVANSSGTYTVKVNTGGCVSAASAGQVVTASSQPTAPNILTGGSTTICVTDSVDLTASTTSTGVTFAWFRNNVLIPGQTGAVYQAKTSGVYTAQAVNNGCASAQSFGILITANGPATPTITQIGSVLTSSSATGNKWYKDGVLIPGATGQNYTPVTSGSYTATVTANNCTSFASNAITVTIAGISDLAPGMEVMVYPNPNNGTFTLGLTGYSKNAVAEIKNITGQLVATENIFISAKSQSNQLFDLKNMPKGVYFLKGNFR